MSTVPIPPEDQGPRRADGTRNWRRVAAWIAVGLLIVLIAVVAGTLLLLHSPAFRAHLLRSAETNLSSATGTAVQMRDFAVHLAAITPTIDLYDVVIQGSPPHAGKPLVHVQHLQAEVEITSFLHREWNLKNVVVNHPVIHVFVDQNGNNNLPKGRGGGTGVFDVGIRRVTVNNGEFFYNDAKSNIDGNIANIELHATSGPNVQRYAGQLSYTDAKLRIDDLNPIVHGLKADFTATPQQLALNHALLTSGKSQVQFQATLTNYRNPHLAANYQASIDMADLQQILKQPSLPTGVVQTTGAARFQRVQGAPMVNGLWAQGALKSQTLNLPTGTAGRSAQVRDMTAQYTLAQGNLNVPDIQGKVFGGAMNGVFTMRDIAGEQISHFDAMLHNVNLSELQSAMNGQSGKQVGLSGTADARIRASWRKSLDTLNVETQAMLHGVLTPEQSAQAPAGNSIPLNADIQAQYSAASNQVSFNRSLIQMPQTTIMLNGTISKAAALHVQAQSMDLHEVEAAANAFGILPQPMGLGGNATFAGTITGDVSQPEITGQLSAAPLAARGTNWQRLQTYIEVRPSQLILKNGSLVAADGRGRIAFDASLGLQDWRFTDASPFQAEVHASQIRAADIKSLARIQAPVSGTVSADLTLHGTRVTPYGQGSVTLTEGTIYGEPVQTANVNFHASGGQLQGRLALQLPDGSAQSTFSYFPQSRGYEFQVQARGIPLGDLQAITQRNIGLAGKADVTGSGKGTLDHPNFELTADIPQLQINTQTINGVRLKAIAANDVADVVLESQVQGGASYLRGSAHILLTDGYLTTAQLETGALSLQPFLTAYLHSGAEHISAQTQIYATLQGPLKYADRIWASATLANFSASYDNNVQIAALQPIQLGYLNGVLTIGDTVLRGPAMDLRLGGSIPITQPAPMNVTATGTADLGVIEKLFPNYTTSGQIQLNVTATGSRTRPNLQGQVQIARVTFAGDSLPVGLQNGNGTLTLSDNRIVIQDFTGKVGGGALKASGSLIYEPDVRFNLVVAGDGIHMLYPQGIRETFNANLTFTGSPGNALLGGQVRLTEVTFSPDFDLMQLADRLSSAAVPTTPPGSFARSLNLNLNLLSTNELNLQSNALTLQGAANLRVQGTAADPAIIGRVNVAGGELMFRGNRYVLQPSTVDFVNPFEINPRLNAAVQTTVNDYDIHLLFRGTIHELRTTYTSEPPLPPSDIINLLVFGSTSEALAANPTPGDLGAVSLIASTVSGEVTNRIATIAGISRLSVDPVLGGNGRDPGARVTIQQRVTGTLFVTFATDAAATQRQVIAVQYQATPRVAVSGVRDQNGGFAFDVRIRKNW